jgi:hypothetical protein
MNWIFAWLSSTFASKVRSTRHSSAGASNTNSSSFSSRDDSVLDVVQLIADASLSFIFVLIERLLRPLK